MTSEIARLWIAGYNTAEIARGLGMTEPEVDKMVMRLIRQRAQQIRNNARIDELHRDESS